MLYPQYFIDDLKNRPVRRYNCRVETMSLFGTVFLIFMKQHHLLFRVGLAGFIAFAVTAFSSVTPFHAAAAASRNSPSALEAEPEPLDLLILHGKLVDGSGKKPRTADVGIRGDRSIIDKIEPEFRRFAKRQKRTA